MNTKLFDSQKFYIISCKDSNIIALLEKNAGIKQTILTASVQFAISDELEADEVQEATDVYDVPVVTPHWVIFSLQCNKRLPFDWFHPSVKKLFAGVIAFICKVGLSDWQRLYALLVYRGADVRLSMSSAITHLVTTSTAGQLIEEIACKINPNVSIVTPDWVTESIKCQTLQRPSEYHPKLLRSLTDIVQHQQQTMTMANLLVAPPFSSASLSSGNFNSGQSSIDVRVGPDNVPVVSVLQRPPQPTVSAPQQVTILAQNLLASQQQSTTGTSLRGQTAPRFTMSNDGSNGAQRFPTQPTFHMRFQPSTQLQRVVSPQSTGGKPQAQQQLLGNPPVIGLSTTSNQHMNNQQLLSLANFQPSLSPQSGLQSANQMQQQQPKKLKSSKQHHQEQSMNEEEKDAIVQQTVRNILSQQHKEVGAPTSKPIPSTVKKIPRSPKSPAKTGKSPKSPKVKPFTSSSILVSQAPSTTTSSSASAATTIVNPVTSVQPTTAVFLHPQPMEPQHQQVPQQPQQQPQQQPPQQQLIYAHAQPTAVSYTSYAPTFHQYSPAVVNMQPGLIMHQPPRMVSVATSGGQPTAIPMHLQIQTPAAAATMPPPAAANQQIANKPAAVSISTPIGGKTVAATTPTIGQVYIGHDLCEVPGIVLRLDMCFVGCIFYMAYSQNKSHSFYRYWCRTIKKHGGNLLGIYNPTMVTHVVAESEDMDEFQVAVQDGRRVVSFLWLSEVIEKGSMDPPAEVPHLPCHFAHARAPNCLRSQVIAVAGFSDSDRSKLRGMLQSLGVIYCPGFCATLSVVVFRKLEGDIYHRCKSLGIAVVNAQFVIDLYHGRLEALSKPLDDRYSKFDVKPNYFTLDKTCSHVKQLLQPWTAGIKVTSGMLTQKNNADKENVRKRSASGDGNSAKRAKFERNSLVVMPASSNQQQISIIFSKCRKHLISELSEMVTSLGGRVVHGNDIETATHLVTPGLFTTSKFLLAVSLGLPILLPQWIDESFHRGAWLDPNPFYVNDKVDLKSSIESAQISKIFEGIKFFVGPTSCSHDSIIRQLVCANGGVITDCLPPLTAGDMERPNHLFVGSEEDSHLIHYLLSRKYGSRVIQSERFVLAATFLQKLDFEHYTLKLNKCPFPLEFWSEPPTSPDTSTKVIIPDIKMETSSSTADVVSNEVSTYTSVTNNTVTSDTTAESITIPRNDESKVVTTTQCTNIDPTIVPSSSQNIQSTAATLITTSINSVISSVVTPSVSSITPSNH